MLLLSSLGGTVEAGGGSGMSRAVLGSVQCAILVGVCHLGGTLVDLRSKAVKPQNVWDGH